MDIREGAGTAKWFLRLVGVAITLGLLGGCGSGDISEDVPDEVPLEEPVNDGAS
jgi:hypothetical protein